MRCFVHYPKVFCIVLLLGALCAVAQEPSLAVSEMATSALVDYTRDLLEENRPDELIPALQELLVRVEGNTDADSLETRSFCLYQIGVSQIKLERFEDARETLDTFLTEFPEDSLASRAGLLISECYAQSGDWASAEKYARDVLADASIDPERRITTLQLLAEALTAQEKWEQAAEPLAEIIRLSDKETVRNRAAAMRLTALGRAGLFDEFMDFLGECGDEVLKDPRVNTVLIAAGDQQREAGHLAVALMLYRSVRPTDELIRLYEEDLQTMEAGLAETYRAIVGSSRSAFEQKQAALRRRFERAQKTLEDLRTGEGYDAARRFRIGQCYMEMQRNWPAWTLFQHIYTTHPDHELAEDARFQTFAVALDMQRWAEAESEARAYLQRYEQGRFADEVSLNLVQLLLQNGRIDDAGAAATAALERSPEHRFIDQIKYLLGYIYFQQMEYRDALAEFEEVFERWPDSRYHEAADYWTAMCRLFLGRYEQAVAAFEGYLNNDAYEQKRFAEDASYRLGVAQYGVGDFEAAEETFLQFIRDWPGSSLLSEALSMAGDLRGAEGDLETALGFYRRARETAVNIDQTNYAVFQTAKIYELQKDWQAVIDMMEEYLLAHGDAGNYAGAGFWIGKAWSALGDEEKALETYIDTVVRFGDKPENGDVDLILRELIKQHRAGMEPEREAALRQRLDDALSRAQREGKDTLRLRLQTLLARISEGAERKRYVDAVLSAADVQDAGALTLLLMATEAAERGDAAQVNEVYRHCLETYEESEILTDVMNTELRMRLQEQRYDAAVELAEEITDRFGYAEPVGLTRKLKADALRLRGDLDEAVETYKELFAVREWRGPLSPEALYWIGVCRLEQDDPREAFAYFQRVYVMYGGYTEWAAQAYEKSLTALEALGRTEAIIQTCREMLANEAIAGRPEGRRARERLNELAPEGEDTP